MRVRHLIGLVSVVALSVALSGCTGSSKSPSGDGATSTAETGNQPAPDAACANLRTDVVADLTPLGQAFGELVGRSTAGDQSGVATATAHVQTALRKIGTDISVQGAKSSSDAVREAAKTSADAVNSLSQDATYVAGIGSLDDIPAATDKLDQATAAITAACK